MSNPMLSLLFSFFVVSFSYAQTLESYNGFFETDPSKSAAAPSNELFADIDLLDSIVIVNLNGPQFGVIAKLKYAYNSENRVSAQESHNWDYTNMALYQSVQSNTSYSGNTGTKITQTANSSLESRSDAYRNSYIYLSGNTIAEDKEDYWLESSAEWQADTKIMLISSDANLTIRHEFEWNGAIEEYEIVGKIEELIDGNQKTVTNFYHFDGGAFIPQDRRITKTQSPTPFVILSHRQNYDVDNGLWIDSYKREVFTDEISKTGYMLIHTFLSGEYGIRDSTRIEFNDFLNPLRDTAYRRNSFDADLAISVRSEYDYYPFERIQQVRVYDFAGSSSEAAGVTDYYRRQIVTSAKAPAAPFPIALSFPNPATPSDLISLNGDNPSTFEFWITDLSGKIHERKMVRAGDQIELNKLNTAGMYYLTLFGDGGQKTWKVFIEH